MQFELPKCICTPTIGLHCGTCYPRFNNEQRAYIQGHTHASYAWAERINGDYSEAEVAAYKQGFNQGLYDELQGIYGTINEVV